MNNKNNLGTIIHGIGASQHLDSSGEVLDIEGMDISSLGGPDSILNFEHNSKDNPSQVCGKVTFAKKIFKQSDCDNDKERYFWDICKKPFVYVKGELFDHPSLDHDGARNIAALLRYDNRDKGKKARQLISFSVEGGKIEKKGMNVTKSIARDLALTIKHCNKMCIVEILDDIKDRKELYKNQKYDCNITEQNLSINPNTYRIAVLKDIKKSEWKPSKEDQEQIKELKIPPKVKKIIEKYDTDNNMRKTLIAGMMTGSPDSKTGIAALTPEKIEGKLEKPFRSKAQRKFAYANPEKFGGKEGIKEWEEKTPKKLPEKIKKSERSKTPIFTTKTTGMPGYDDMLKNPDYFKNKKGVHFEIKDMSPEEYLNIAADGYYKQNKGTKYEFPSVEHAKQSLINQRRNSKNMDKIKSYDVLHMPTLDFKNQWTTSSGEKAVNQEGLHRTIHAMDSGLKSIPVLVVKDANEIKKSQPPLRNKDLGLGQDVRMDVKHVDPDKTYKNPKSTPEKPLPDIASGELENKKLVQMAQQGMKQGLKDPNKISSKKQKQIRAEAEKGYENILKPQEYDGTNVSIPGSQQRSFSFEKDKPEAPGVKSVFYRNRFKRPLSQQLGAELHEANHGFFTDIENKYSKDHSLALSKKMLKDHFHPEDIKNVRDFLKKSKYKVGNPYFNEEHITHISDILNSPTTRKRFYRHIGLKNAPNLLVREKQRRINEINEAKKTLTGKDLAKKIKHIKSTPGFENITPEEMDELDRAKSISKRLKTGWKKTAEYISNPLQLADFFNQIGEKQKKK